MAQHTHLHLNALVKSIADSCQSAIISFDSHLRIVDHTSLAAKLMDLQPTLDDTLTAGTDANIWGDWQKTLVTILDKGQPAHYEAVKYTRNDSSRLLSIHFVPLQTPGEKLLGAAAVIQDATDKLDADYEMAQAERLMAIGKVAGNVAHELNNPLDGILRYVNLAMRVLEQDQPEKAKEYLLHCRTGLQRMAQIITEMLEFSRTTNLAFETSPIDKTIDDALRAMETTLRNIQVEVVREDAGPLPRLRSDSIFQVCCNLIKNAADAMGEKGTLAITISRAGEKCQLTFHDSGPGISADPMDEIFKPFYTTKPKGRGTGLGLAICKDILEKLNGTITAQNHPHGGALFTVQLPCGKPTDPNRSTP